MQEKKQYKVLLLIQYFRIDLPTRKLDRQGNKKRPEQIV